MAALLVVIHDFHMQWTRRLVRPLKADPPLVVDADAVLALPVALQGLESVTRQCRQISERVRRLEPVQLEPRGPLDARQRLDALPGGEGRRSAVSIADDHSRHDRTNYELRHA
jgi:hypothetical protein